MAEKSVKINRAPVMTLWAAVVAERMGYDREAALTLGKAVAGLNAKSKKKRIGIIEEHSHEDGDAKKEKADKEKQDEDEKTVAILGRPVPALQTKDGVRATAKGKPITPTSVQRYLEKRFGEDLTDVRAAMETLAQHYPPSKLAGQAYALYEQFRPTVPEGEKGWGAAGKLDLSLIRSLAKEKA